MSPEGFLQEQPAALASLPRGNFVQTTYAHESAKGFWARSAGASPSETAACPPGGDRVSHESRVCANIYLFITSLLLYGEHMTPSPAPRVVPGTQEGLNKYL